jgi:HEAT repeat protein
MPVRAAAFAGLLRTDPKHRSRQILDALEGPSLEFAHVALAEAGSTDDPELRQLLMAAWPRLAPDRQIGIVYLFKASGDPATLPVVLAAAQSPDAAVRNAAWTALGELGDASTVSPLAEAAASRQGDERTAARQALVALHRGPIAAALVAQLETAPAPVQAEIARALRDRAENGATPALLALTGDERASVRQAALRTLAPLTEAYHWEPLLDVLLRLPDEESRRLARDALAALNQRAKSGPPLDPAILAQKLAAASGPLRIQLLPLCAWFSDDRLRAALRADLESADAGVRAAAANAICATEDKTLLADLVKLAGNAEDATVRTSALARAAALVVKHGASLPGSDPGTTIATLYRQTARPEDKWLILGAAARLPYRATLQLAEEAMADASVRAEAEFALLQIARLLGSAEAVAVRAAMARLATEATEEKVRTEARIWRGDGAPGVRQIYNLPAGDAGTMLREVAATASLKLDYRPDDVRAVSGRTLQGDLTVTEALTRLLAGSPLEAVADPASGTITVRRRER